MHRYASSASQSAWWADGYLADASRQVTDARLDALMDKLAADYGVPAR